MADKALIDLVLDRAVDDPGLDEESREHILRALLGEDPLSASTDTRRDAVADPAKAVPEPVGAYLAAVEVAGFRGVGARSRLQLDPGPGLTIVTGRNGTGKSSFAEGLELALTGDSYRWQNRHPQWSEDWRNLHTSSPCEIRVQLAVDTVGPTTVGVDWGAGADLGDRSSWMRRAGAEREGDLSGLGWAEALRLYRPILSYEEMGGLLQAKPFQLYDALSQFLGLESVVAAIDVLSAAVKTADEVDRECKALRRTLKEDLDRLDDTRATAAGAELAKWKPDLAVLGALATGSVVAPGLLDRLRALTTLVPPSPEDLAQGAAALNAANQDLNDAAGRAVEADERRRHLKAEALDLHSEHGDQPCPVCAGSLLDESWHERVSAELASDDNGITRLRSARDRLARAVARARALIEQCPRVVEVDGVELPGMATALEEVRRWLDAPEADTALAGHLVARGPGLAAAFEALRADATQALLDMDDAWSPLAARLATWLELRRRADAGAAGVRTLKAAEKWLKAAATRLRAERFDPLAERAKEIWTALREQSAVDLGAVVLKGQRNTRHVELQAHVDGEESGALGVMSQGELHALALALFLPRATAERSPFRFVVLDDPVQAMDPARIDSFARLLADIAKDRQVIVFSHDDRLPDAVRRMAIPDLRILEITRDRGSVVEVRPCLDPARRALDDAVAVGRDPRVTDDIRQRVLPGLCRLAVEAAAREVFYRSGSESGVDRLVLEQRWTDARRTRERVGLALGVDAGSWAGKQKWRRETLEVCGRGAHTGVTTDPKAVVDDLRRTVDELLACGA